MSADPALSGALFVTHPYAAESIALRDREVDSLPVSVKLVRTRHHLDVLPSTRSKK